MKISSILLLVLLMSSCASRYNYEAISEVTAVEDHAGRGTASTSGM